MKFNEVLDNCKVYEAGKPIELLVREYGIDPKDIIKLASNENPYGTSPKVEKKIKELASSMYIYPDDSMYELKEALANRFNVQNKNIIIGAGSDQILDFCVKAKCTKSSKILMSKTTFAMYEIYGRQAGATILKTKDDEHNLEQFLSMYKEHGADIIFLCLPNNPLGECLNKDDVYAFLDEINKNTLVIIDGAYQEYASFKDKKKEILANDLINKYNNCIYLGTFSKAYALGGMRIGYGIAKKNIIQALFKLRPPFNITTLSLVASLEALKDKEFVQECISKNFKEMKRYEEYAKKKDFDYIPSYTNFISIKLNKLFSSSDIAHALLKRGIIVRNLVAYGFNAIRITIGSKEQNTIVFKILDEVLEKLK